MSFKNRVERLEAMLKSPEELTGVLYYHEELIIVDGHVFQSIEDVPPDLRAKYPGLLVGRVKDQYGNSADVTAPGGSGENEHAEKFKMRKEN